MPRPLPGRPVLGAALLKRLLDAPDLERRVQSLPAPALRQLVLEIGLEDAGELVALTSFEQLRDLLDEDLWRARAPGLDESFDAKRFALWLELLHESGDAALADRLEQLSEDFLAFALSRAIFVIDLAAERAAADADQARLLDKLVDAHDCQELDGLLVVARFETGWDALWSGLLTLDERHGELARTVLRRVALATSAEAEAAGGLALLLSETETLAADAAGEREDRRAERGFISPADARAFLALAQRAPATPEVDPITRVYFREIAGSGRQRAARGPSARATKAAPAQGIASAGSSSSALAHSGVRLFGNALAALAREDASAHQRAIEELAYLANVLVAGDTSRAQSFTPLEAAQRAVELCEAGLRAVAASSSGGDAAALLGLRAWGAVGLFRIAWAAEHAAAQRAVSSR